MEDMEKHKVHKPLKSISQIGHAVKPSELKCVSAVGMIH